MRLEWVAYDSDMVDPLTLPTVRIRKPYFSKRGLESDGQHLPQKWMETKLFSEALDEITHTRKWTFNNETGNHKLLDDPFYNLLYSQILLRESEFSWVGQPLTGISTDARWAERCKVIRVIASGFGAAIGALTSWASGEGESDGPITTTKNVIHGAVLGALEFGQLYFERKVARSDCTRWAQMHMVRSKQVAEMLLIHIDKTQRIQNLNVPVRLPGQSENEYKTDLKLYAETIFSAMNTILEGSLLIHFAMRPDMLGKTKGVLYNGDDRCLVFLAVLDSLSRTIEDRVPPSVKEADRETYIANVKSFYRRMDDLSSTKFPFLVQPKAFIKMINEIDTTLRDTMQDLELFINIRNGEALRALEVERFGFANVDLKAMVRDREDAELEKLNSSLIGQNVTKLSKDIPSQYQRVLKQIGPRRPESRRPRAYDRFQLKS